METPCQGQSCYAMFGDGVNPTARRRLVSWRLTAALVLLLLASLEMEARAGIQDNGYWRFATAKTVTTVNYDPGICTAPDCTDYGTVDGGEVNTSDYTVVQYVYIFAATDGEAFTFQELKPDGTVYSSSTVTYSASDGCFTWDAAAGGGSVCGTNGFENFWSGPYIDCALPTGTWTLQLYDNSNLAISHTFNLQHNPQSPLGISSPAENQLFDIDQNNFTATSLVPYIAGTNTGNLISWAATLNYKTSGGYGITFFDLPGFGTTNMEEQDETYQSEGGQVQVTAQTTADDGSTIQDCVTYYIDGPQTGITDSTITGQLDTLYQQSQSYPTDPSEQYPPTPNLMTRVAEVESSYAQFQYPGQGVPPGEPNLYPGVDGKWPYESPGGGANIGLMQLSTTFPDAWDWTTNSADAINLFSGTVSPNKITLAGTYATDIINGDPKSNPPIDDYYKLTQPVGSQLENMALVLYGGWLAGLGCGSVPSQTCLQSQYYIPTCSGTQGTIKQKGQTYLTCSTLWQWNVNTAGQPGGVTYVSKIRGNLQ